MVSCLLIGGGDCPSRLSSVRMGNVLGGEPCGCADGQSDRVGRDLSEPGFCWYGDEESEVFLLHGPLLVLRERWLVLCLALSSAYVFGARVLCGASHFRHEWYFGAVLPLLVSLRRLEVFSGSCRNSFSADSRCCCSWMVVLASSGLLKLLIQVSMALVTALMMLLRASVAFCMMFRC